MPNVGSFLIAVGKFVTFGKAAGTAAGIIGAFTVAGTVHLTSRMMKLPKGFNDNDQGRQRTVRSTVEPQKLVYGETMVSGPLTYAQVSGAHNKYLHQVVALAGHELTSIQAVYLDDKSIDLTDTNVYDTSQQTEPYSVRSGFFGPKTNESGTSETVVYIDYRLGASSQTAYAGLLADNVTSNEYLSTHRGDGIASLYTRWTIHEGSAETWDAVGGVQNIKAVVRGKKIYDPRLDVNAGNSAGDNPTTAAYVVYSDNTLSTGSSVGDYDRSNQGQNPALILADYLMDSKFGLGLSASKIDWDSIVAAADHCDQLVAIPTSATQKRFFGSGVIFGNDEHKKSIEKILSAMNGTLVYSQGKYIVRAGVYFAATETLTEDDLIGPVQITTSIPKADRINTIKGVFIDPSENYKDMEFGPVTVSGAVARDNGETLTEELKLPFTSNRYAAQRIAKKIIHRSFLQTTIQVPVNLKGMRIAIGDRVNVTLSALNEVDSGNWSPKIFKCVAWSFSENSDGGINLTLVEDDTARYVDPAENEYSTVTAEGTIVRALPDVPSPTNFTATAGINRVELNWTNPSNAAAWEQVWLFASDTNTTPTDSSTPIAKFRGTSFTHLVNGGDTKYYWIQAVRYAPGSTPSSGQSNAAKSPFIASSPTNVTASKITNAVMGDDSVDTAQVVDNAIGSDQITDLQSSNYSNTAGSEDGWKILQDGSAEFNNVVIRGNVNATTGTVGGLTVGSDKLYVGTGNYNNSNTAFYVDDQGQFSLKDKLVWSGSALTIDGGGTFSGSLSAASGTFTGALSGGTISIGSNNDIFKADSNGIYLGNATFGSAPFRVTPAGALTATNATITGDITATSLTINEGATLAASSAFTRTPFVSFTNIGNTNFSPAVSGSEVTWTQVTGTYSWNHKLVSDKAFKNGAFVSFRVKSGEATDTRYMIGLADANTGAHFSQIDYALFIRGTSGDILAYESGINIGGFPTTSLNVGDVCTIVYDGEEIRYIINGVVKRTVDLSSSPITAGLYAHIAIDDGANNTTHTIEDFRFGSISDLALGVTIQDGGITMAGGGSIKGGQTGYDTGTGFFLGYDSSAYKFSIGNSGGNKLIFDGTDLTVTGAVNATSGTFTGSIAAGSGTSVTIVGDASYPIYSGDVYEGNSASNDPDPLAASFRVSSDGTVFAKKIDIRDSDGNPLLSSADGIGAALLSQISLSSGAGVDSVSGTTSGDAGSFAITTTSSSVQLIITAKVAIKDNSIGTLALSGQDSTEALAIERLVGGSNYNGAKIRISFEVDGSVTDTHDITFVDYNSNQSPGSTEIAVDANYVGGSYNKYLTSLMDAGGALEYIANTGYAGAYGATAYAVVTSKTLTAVSAGSHTIKIKFALLDKVSPFGAITSTSSTGTGIYYTGQTSGTLGNGQARRLYELPDTNPIRFLETAANTFSEAGSSVLTSGGTVSGDLSVTGSLSVTGDFNLTGDINQYNVTNLDVVDKTITVSKGGTQALSDGAGLIVDRGTAADASILWDETNDFFDFSHGITATSGNIKANTTDGYLQARSLILANSEITDTHFGNANQMIVDANDGDSDVPNHGNSAGGYPFGVYFLGDNAGTTKTLGSGLVKLWHTGHFKKAHIDHFVGLYDGTQALNIGTNTITSGDISATRIVSLITSSVGIKTTYGQFAQFATDSQIDLVSTSAGTWGSAINLVEGNNTSNTDVWSIARKTTGGAGDSSLNFNFGTSNDHANTNRVAFSSTGVITWSGGGSANANTAYTYSQVGHLPLAGGTLSGTLDAAAGLALSNTNITEVNTLYFNDPGPGEGIRWSNGNWAIYESPDDLTTNSAGNLQFVSGGNRKVTFNTSGDGYFAGTISSGAITSSGLMTVTADWTSSYGSINISHSQNTLGGLGLRANGVYKGGLIYRDGTQGAYWELNSYESESLKFKTNNTVALTLDSSQNATITGNLLTGDASNISMSSSTAGQLQVLGNGYTGGFALDASAMHIYHNSSLRDLILGTNETARITIDGNGGATVFSTPATFSGGKVITGQNEIAHSQHTGWKLTATDDTAGAHFYAMYLNHNISGDTAFTGDFDHVGLFIDVDSSAQGGDTSHEHRIYGIYNDVRATGDSDLVVGSRTIGRADNFGSGQITTIYGADNQAVAHNNDGYVAAIIGARNYAQDSTDTSGDVGSIIGAQNLAYLGSSSTVDTPAAWGSWNIVQVSAAQNNTSSNYIPNVYGTMSEIQIDSDTSTNTKYITNAFGVYSLYDENDSDDNYITVTNSYLFYGDYQGTLTPTNPWGLYLADTDVPSYIAGQLRMGTTDRDASEPSYSFSGDTDTGMYSVNANVLGFSTGGTNRLTITSSGLFTQDLTYDNRGAFNSSNDTGQIILGAYNGPADGTGTSQGPAIVWKPNYSGYTKESLKIAGVATNNYFDMDMVFYTSGTSNSTGAISERFRLTQGGEAIFAGTISSGAITSSGAVSTSNTNGFQITDIGKLHSSSNNLYLTTETNGTGIVMNSRTGFFTFQNSGTNKFQIHSNGSFNFYSGNLTSVGTISSGAITSSSTVTGTAVVVKRGTTYAQSTDYLYVGGNSLDGADAAIYIGNHGGGSGYGWRLYYHGSGSGNLNDLSIQSENLGSPVNVLRFNQDGAATFANDVTVSGNLYVTGSTTSVNVEDLNVEQGEITLNYGSGDTSAAANGAGIRIQDAVDANTDATILWDATNDEFDFSHGATFGGNIYAPEYLIHTGNSGTYLRFQTDRATLRSGGGAIVDAHDNGNLYLTGTTLQVYGNYSSTGTISSGAITATGEIDVNLSAAGKYFEGGSGNTRRLSITSGTNVSEHAKHTFDIASTNGMYAFQVNSADILTLESTAATVEGDLIVDSSRVLITGDGNYVAAGSSGGGKSAVMGNTQTRASGVNDYRAYFSYDTYWDQANHLWKARRTTLGRKWLQEMGYHKNEYRLRFYDGGGSGSIANGWADTDWTDLIKIDYQGNANLAGDITTTGIILGSGTANDLQADGKTAFFGSAMFGTAANTNTPLKAVHIKGSGAQSIRIEDTASSNQIYDITSTYNGGLTIVDATASITPLSIAHTTGNATFAGSVNVSGDLNIASVIAHTGDLDTYFQFNAANTARIVVGGSQKFVVNTNGVSINNGTLDMTSNNINNAGTISSGAITADGGGNQSTIKSSSDAPLIVQSTDAATGIQFTDPNGSGYLFYLGGSDHLYLNSSKFSVAGSTLATGYQFQVNGSANLTGSLAINGTLVIDVNKRLLVSDGSASAPYMTFAANTNTGFYRPALDNIGFAIGGVARAFMSATQFNMSGNGVFSGNVTAYSSDARLKTGVKRIERPLEKLQQIRGVEFDWIDGIEELGFVPSSKHETGVIAQEIQAVIPDAVAPAPFDNNYLTVHKDKIVPLLIEAIKAQQEQINDLKQAIEKLKMENTNDKDN